jgi:hypothetical protein
MQYCHDELQKLVIEDEKAGSARLQPCKSPVWDTAIAVRALAASGVRPDNPAMREAIAWLLARQVKRRGDWTETVHVEPGGWAFEYANDFYPDNDDTAMVLMALQTQFSGAPAARGALPGDCPNFRLSENGTVPFNARLGPIGRPDGDLALSAADIANALMIVETGAPGVDAHFTYFAQFLASCGFENGFTGGGLLRDRFVHA